LIFSLLDQVLRKSVLLNKQKPAVLRKPVLTAGNRQIQRILIYGFFIAK